MRQVVGATGRWCDRSLVLLIFGRIKERRCDFRLVKVGISWKFEIILFHELIASGKKLFLYLAV